MKKKKLISAVLTAALCLSAAWPAAAFADSVVSAEPEAMGETTEETVVHHKYLNGFEDATIRPEVQVTRAQAAQMLSSVSEDSESGTGNDGEKVQNVSFSDVKEGAWYYDAVMELTEKGILKGYQDGTFRPDRKITRAEFASVLKAYHDILGNSDEEAGDTSAVEFSDVSEDSWYYEAVSEAAAQGWITGYSGGLFKPENKATRADSVTMINRLLDRSADKNTINL